MSYVSKDWEEHQRKRWMRPDAARWMRPDAARYMRHDAHRFLPPDQQWELKYSPDQPRVPAGNPDGGQWTAENGGSAGASTSTTILPKLSPVLAGFRPKLPKLPPETVRQFNAFVRAVAVWLAENGGTLASSRLRHRGFITRPR